jgi:uncharacterized protein
MEITMRGFVIATVLAGVAASASAAPGFEADLRAGDARAVAMALSGGADANDRLSGGLMTPLGVAAARGDLAMVQVLLAGGADVNAANAWGMTPLSIAARSCDATPGVVAFLLAAGAYTEIPSGAGMTPLLSAVMAGRPDLARILFASGADADAVNIYGDGALNFAIYRESPGLVQAALGAGADTDPLAALFSTARFYAAGHAGAETAPCPTH